MTYIRKLKYTGNKNNVISQAENKEQRQQQYSIWQ